MDCLTQSFAPRAVASPLATRSHEPDMGLNRTISRADSLAPSFVSTLAPSYFTTETTTTDGLIQSTNAAFSQLRTAVPGDVGIEGEELVAIPDVKRGDARFYSRVLVHLVFIEDPKEGRDSKIRISAEEEWIIEGALWIMADDSILFITSSQPLIGPITSAQLLQKSLLRSLNPFRHRHHSPAASRSPTPDPLRSPRPQHRLGDEEDSDSDSDSDDEDTTATDEHAKSSFTGFVRKVFNRSASADDRDPLGLKMTRTRTGERREREREVGLERSRSREGRLRSRVKLECPLPTYQGHPITALSFPAFSSEIVSLHYYSSTSAVPSHSHTSSPITTRRRESGVINADDLFPTPHIIVSGHSTEKSGDKEKKKNPRVELLVRSRFRKYAEREREDGRGRDVLFGIEFMDQMLSSEATVFKERVEKMIVKPK